jgi:hypothetical protein
MRSPRYRLRVPIRYRPEGESDWIAGVTENISRTGILLRGGRALPLDTSFEILFFLSSEAGSEILREGRVVRVVGASEAGGAPALGAIIDINPNS